MNIPVRIGMDTSKSVFQLHGVDENEVVVVRRQFRRAEMIRYFERLPPVLIAIVLRQFAPLGTPAAIVWARGKANPASVCESLREARQERRG
jgi:transposase